jgi:hypothetical protein
LKLADSLRFGSSSVAAAHELLAVLDNEAKLRSDLSEALALNDAGKLSAALERAKPFPRVCADPVYAQAQAALQRRVEQDKLIASLTVAVNDRNIGSCVALLKLSTGLGLDDTVSAVTRARAFVKRVTELRTRTENLMRAKEKDLEALESCIRAATGGDESGDGKSSDEEDPVISQARALLKSLRDTQQRLKGATEERDWKAIDSGLDRASKLGLSESDEAVSEARKLKRAAAAVERVLIEAVQSRDVAVLTRAIAQADTLRLGTGNEVLERARNMVRALEGQSKARSELSAALTSPVTGTDVKLLSAALDAAKAEGLAPTDSQCVAAQQRIQLLLELQKLVRALDQVLDPNAASPSAGAAPATLSEKQVSLLVSRLTTAYESVLNATHLSSSGVDMMGVAADSAPSGANALLSSVPSSVGRARAWLTAMSELRRALAVATESNHPVLIANCVTRANAWTGRLDAGVDRALGEAVVLRSGLLEIQSAVSSAINERDLSALNSWLERAARLGVNINANSNVAVTGSPALSAAESTPPNPLITTLLEAKQLATQLTALYRSLRSAMTTQRTEELEAALRTAETLGVSAENDEKVRAAQSLLMSLAGVARVRQALSDAIKSRDRRALSSALEAAQAYNKSSATQPVVIWGNDSQYLDATQLLQRLVEHDTIHQLLLVAWEAKDDKRCESLVARASAAEPIVSSASASSDVLSGSAGGHGGIRTEAQTALLGRVREWLSTLHSLRKRLTAATAARDVSALRAALLAASDAKFDDASTTEAQRLYELLSGAVSGLDAVLHPSEANATQSVAALNEALNSAARAGLEDNHPLILEAKRTRKQWMDLDRALQRALTSAPRTASALNAALEAARHASYESEWVTAAQRALSSLDGESKVRSGVRDALLGLLSAATPTLISVSSTTGNAVSEQDPAVSRLRSALDSLHTALTSQAAGSSGASAPSSAAPTDAFYVAALSAYRLCTERENTLTVVATSHKARNVAACEAALVAWERACQSLMSAVTSALNAYGSAGASGLDAGVSTPAAPPPPPGVVAAREWLEQVSVYRSRISRLLQAKQFDALALALGPSDSRVAAALGLVDDPLTTQAVAALQAVSDARAVCLRACGTAIPQTPAAAATGHLAPSATISSGITLAALDEALRTATRAGLSRDDSVVSAVLSVRKQLVTLHSELRASCTAQHTERLRAALSSAQSLGVDEETDTVVRLARGVLNKCQARDGTRAVLRSAMEAFTSAQESSTADVKTGETSDELMRLQRALRAALDSGNVAANDKVVAECERMIRLAQDRATALHALNVAVQARDRMGTARALQRCEELGVSADGTIASEPLSGSATGGSGSAPTKAPPLLPRLSTLSEEPAYPIPLESPPSFDSKQSVLDSPFTPVASLPSTGGRSSVMISGKGHANTPQARLLASARALMTGPSPAVKDKNTARSALQTVLTSRSSLSSLEAAIKTFESATVESEDESGGMMDVSVEADAKLTQSAKHTRSQLSSLVSQLSAASAARNLPLLHSLLTTAMLQDSAAWLSSHPSYQEALQVRSDCIAAERALAHAAASASDRECEAAIATAETLGYGAGSESEGVPPSAALLAARRVRAQFKQEQSVRRTLQDALQTASLPASSSASLSLAECQALTQQLAAAYERATGVSVLVSDLGNDVKSALPPATSSGTTRYVLPSTDPLALRVRAVHTARTQCDAQYALLEKAVRSGDESECVLVLSALGASSIDGASRASHSAVEVVRSAQRLVESRVQWRRAVRNALDTKQTSQLDTLLQSIGSSSGGAEQLVKTSPAASSTALLIDEANRYLASASQTRSTLRSALDTRSAPSELLSAAQSAAQYWGDNDSEVEQAKEVGEKWLRLEQELQTVVEKTESWVAGGAGLPPATPNAAASSSGGLSVVVPPTPSSGSSSSTASTYVAIDDSTANLNLLHSHLLSALSTASSLQLHSALLSRAQRCADAVQQTLTLRKAVGDAVRDKNITALRTLYGIAAPPTGLTRRGSSAATSAAAASAALSVVTSSSARAVGAVGGEWESAARQLLSEAEDRDHCRAALCEVAEALSAGPPPSAVPSASASSAGNEADYPSERTLRELLHHARALGVVAADEKDAEEFAPVSVLRARLSAITSVRNQLRALPPIACGVVCDPKLSAGSARVQLKAALLSAAKVLPPDEAVLVSAQRAAQSLRASQSSLSAALQSTAPAAIHSAIERAIECGVHPGTGSEDADASNEDAVSVPHLLVRAQRWYALVCQHGDALQRAIASSKAGLVSGADLSKVISAAQHALSAALPASSSSAGGAAADNGAEADGSVAQFVVAARSAATQIAAEQQLCAALTAACTIRHASCLSALETISAAIDGARAFLAKAGAAASGSGHVALGAALSRAEQARAEITAHLQARVKLRGAVRARAVSTVRTLLAAHERATGHDSSSAPLSDSKEELDGQLTVVANAAKEDAEDSAVVRAAHALLKDADAARAQLKHALETLNIASLARAVRSSSAAATPGSASAGVAAEEEDEEEATYALLDAQGPLLVTARQVLSRAEAARARIHSLLDFCGGTTGAGSASSTEEEDKQPSGSSAAASAALAARASAESWRELAQSVSDAALRAVGLSEEEAVVMAARALVSGRERTDHELAQATKQLSAPRSGRDAKESVSPQQLQQLLAAAARKGLSATPTFVAGQSTLHTFAARLALRTELQNALALTGAANGSKPTGCVCAPPDRARLQRALRAWREHVITSQSALSSSSNSAGTAALALSADEIEIERSASQRLHTCSAQSQWRAALNCAVASKDYLTCAQLITPANSESGENKNSSSAAAGGWGVGVDHLPPSVAAASGSAEDGGCDLLSTPTVAAARALISAVESARAGLHAALVSAQQNRSQNNLLARVQSAVGRAQLAGVREDEPLMVFAQACVNHSAAFRLHLNAALNGSASESDVAQLSALLDSATGSAVSSGAASRIPALSSRASPSSTPPLLLIGEAELSEASQCLERLKTNSAQSKQSVDEKSITQAASTSAPASSAEQLNALRSLRVAWTGGDVSLARRCLERLDGAQAEDEKETAGSSSLDAHSAELVQNVREWLQACDSAEHALREAVQSGMPDKIDAALRLLTQTQRNARSSAPPSAASFSPSREAILARHAVRQAGAAAQELRGAATAASSTEEWERLLSEAQKLNNTSSESAGALRTAQQQLTQRRAVHAACHEALSSRSLQACERALAVASEEKNSAPTSASSADVVAVQQLRAQLLAEAAARTSLQRLLQTLNTQPTDSPSTSIPAATICARLRSELSTALSSGAVRASETLTSQCHAALLRCESQIELLRSLATAGMLSHPRLLPSSCSLFFP